MTQIEYYFFQFIYLFYQVLLHACNARPHHTHKPWRKHHHKNRRVTRHDNNPNQHRVRNPIPEMFLSSRVAFSSRPPSDTPLALKYKNLKAASESKNAPSKSRHVIGQSISGRTKRAAELSRQNDQSQFSEEEIMFAEPVCRSFSQWVVKSDSYDIWGNLVQIEQNINVDGQQIHQYFYETTCKKSQSAEGVAEHMTCMGFDSKSYSSVCRDQYSWVYAYVRNMSGERGWSLIELSTSCGCALIERNQQQAFIDNITT